MKSRGVAKSRVQLSVVTRAGRGRGAGHDVLKDSFVGKEAENVVEKHLGKAIAEDAMADAGKAVGKKAGEAAKKGPGKKAMTISVATPPVEQAPQQELQEPQEEAQQLHNREAAEKGPGKKAMTISVAIPPVEQAPQEDAQQLQNREEPQEEAQQLQNREEENSEFDDELSSDEEDLEENEEGEDEHVVQMMGDGTVGGISSIASVPSGEMQIDPKVIRIEDGCFLGNTAAQEITKTFKSFFPGPYPTWKLVSPKKKRYQWKKFQEKFAWSAEATELVHGVWLKTAAKRYRGTLCLARKKAKESAGTTKISETRNHNPDFIKKDVWQQLIDKHWGKEGYEGKCEKASQNRLSAKHGTVSTHTGGSVNFPTHKKKLEQDRKRPVGRHEVYLRTHKKQKGKGPFVDKKSAVVDVSSSF